MLSEFASSWKLIGVAAAIYFVLSAFRRKRQATGNKTVVLERSSLAGRAGGALMAQAVLSVISDVLGFPVVAAFFSIICAIPLMIMGGEVHLPEFVKAWPRSIVTKFKGTFIDVKDTIKEKIHDGKDAVVGKITGKDGEPEESIAEVSPDSDEYWGGPPIPHVSPEEMD